MAHVAQWTWSRNSAIIRIKPRNSGEILGDQTFRYCGVLLVSYGFETGFKNDKSFKLYFFSLFLFVWGFFREMPDADVLKLFLAWKWMCLRKIEEDANAWFCLKESYALCKSTMLLPSETSWDTVNIWKNPEWQYSLV